MEKLEEFRTEIDSIDSELVSLLCKRMELSAQIGQYKKQANLPIYDPEREEALKNKIIESVSKQYRLGIAEVYSMILKVSKDLQL